MFVNSVDKHPAFSVVSLGKQRGAIALNLSVEGTSVASRQARMRLSDQMKRVLLVLLKAREDPEWALAKAGFIPRECPEHLRRFLLEGRAGGWLSMKEVIRILEGEKAFYGRGLVDPTYAESYRRSLARLRSGGPSLGGGIPGSLDTCGLLPTREERRPRKSATR